MKNKNKLKQIFRNEKIRTNFLFGHLIEYSIFPERHNTYYRRIRTQQERNATKFHELEYKREYNLKIRGKRSSSNLPSLYDDLLCFKNFAKSWKDKSKRKKQYKED